MSEVMFKRALVATIVVWLIGTAVVLGAGAYRQIQIGVDAIDRALTVRDYCVSTYHADTDVDRCLRTGVAPKR